MDYELPYPPSVNHYLRRVGKKTLISREGRKYRKAVEAILFKRAVRPLLGRLAITVDLYPPDRRRRDLDNALKALLDAMQHGGAYHDDAQIDDLHLRRGEPVPGGLVCVRIVPHTAGVQKPPGPQAAQPEERSRTCLKCGKVFPSTGPANRICSTCGQENLKLSLSEPQLQEQRGGKRRRGQFDPLSAIEVGS
jgi:Holliday junction resolvase RusA-like endonuclease